MTNVSLDISGITFTFQDGDVNTCKGAPSSNLDNSMISGTGPMSAYNYDYEGCGKSINISGVLTPADTDRTSTGTCKTILAQKQWLESLINGQQESISITSRYESTSVDTTAGNTDPQQANFEQTYCMVQSMTFEESAGNMAQLPFNMTLLIGERIVIESGYILQEDESYILQEDGDKLMT